MAGRTPAAEHAAQPHRFPAQPAADRRRQGRPGQPRVMRRASGERSPSALRNRNFALLWSGQTISVVGNGLFLVALPLEVLQISNSPLNLALVISAQTIPSVLLLLIGGTLVDRLSRRVVMLVSDSVRGTSVLRLAALVARHDARLWEFIVLAVVFGSADAFFLPASTAIAPDI